MQKQGMRREQPGKAEWGSFFLALMWHKLKHKNLKMITNANTSVSCWFQGYTLKLPQQWLKSECQREWDLSLLLYLPVLSPKDAYNTWISPLVLLTSPKIAPLGCILQNCPLRLSLLFLLLSEETAPSLLRLSPNSKLHSFPYSCLP